MGNCGHHSGTNWTSSTLDDLHDGGNRCELKVQKKVGCFDAKAARKRESAPVSFKDGRTTGANHTLFKCSIIAPEKKHGHKNWKISKQTHFESENDDFCSIFFTLCGHTILGLFLAVPYCSLLFTITFISLE